MERNIRLNWGLLVKETIKRRKERKISQRRLATIAEVSQPTISRFEQQKEEGTIYFVSHMDVFICFFRQALKSWKPRAFVSENEGDEFAFLIH